MDSVRDQLLKTMLSTLFTQAVELCDEMEDMVERDHVDFVRNGLITEYFETIELLRDPEKKDSALSIYAQDMVRVGSPFSTERPLTSAWQMLKDIQEEKIDLAIAMIGTLHENIWGDEDSPRPVMN